MGNLDNINHPPHYQKAGLPFECIELCGLYDFTDGNAIKYLYRHTRKNGLEDLRKCNWYLRHKTGDFTPIHAPASVAATLLRSIGAHTDGTERRIWEALAEGNRDKALMLLGLMMRLAA